jgi:hypothetical protein
MRLGRRITLAAAVVGALVVSSGALASGGVVGTYTTKIKSPAQLKGTWALTLAKSGSYTVALNGQPVARGSYSATTATITFAHERGSSCTGRGIYAWKKSGKVATFVPERESSSCQARAIVLAHRFTQVR